MKIFAQLGTNKKVISSSKQTDIQYINHKLQQIFGGVWVLVEILEKNEFVMFEDDSTYMGFEPCEAKRYSNQIILLF